jgi:hypothetical protein
MLLSSLTSLMCVLQLWSVGHLQFSIIVSCLGWWPRCSGGQPSWPSIRAFMAPYDLLLWADPPWRVCFCSPSVVLLYQSVSITWFNGSFGIQIMQLFGCKVFLLFLPLHADGSSDDVNKGCCNLWYWSQYWCWQHLFCSTSGCMKMEALQQLAGICTLHWSIPCRIQQPFAL